MEPKNCKESRVIKASIVLPPDTNNHGNIFGGKVMSYIDDVAAISAMRHSRKNVVTASTDSVDFLGPVKLGQSICLESYVTWTGRTSMEVFVKVVAENLMTGERTLTTTSFLSFVALDEKGVPTEVPSVIPETDEEIQLNRTAPDRNALRKQRRKDMQHFVKNMNTENHISK